MPTGHTDVFKRDASEISDWTQALIDESLISKKEAKPTYKNWDFLYPKMNRVRLAREAGQAIQPEAGSTENNEPSATGQKAGSNPQTKDESMESLKENLPAQVGRKHLSKIFKRPVGFTGSEPSNGVSDVDNQKMDQDHGKAPARKLPETEIPLGVSGVSETSKYEKEPQTENFRKQPSGDTPTKTPPVDITTRNAATKEENELPAKEIGRKISKSIWDGQDKLKNARADAEPDGREAQIPLKSGLESSWGSGSHDPDELQQERRLGDARSVPDFNNLDIRYLGGNDLNLNKPPVDITSFQPEHVTGKQSQPANQGGPSSGKPVDLKQARSAGNQNIAFAILMTPLALVTALKF